VRPEGLGKFKKITLSGIERAIFRFVTQCLNHHATACPSYHAEDEETEKAAKAQQGAAGP
jgi:hypothetical protein